MFTLLYTYFVGYSKQTARAQKTFNSRNLAIDAANRMQSTPGYLDVQVWHGATKIF